MPRAKRISPEETRKKVLNDQALLVCSYRDDRKFDRYHLEGAVPLSSLQAKADNLPPDQEIIFYCN